MYKWILLMVTLSCLYFFGTKEGMLVPKIIFFTSKECKECQQMNSYWQELNTVYVDKLTTIDCSKPISVEARNAMKKYNIKKLPAIVGIHNNQVTYYDENDKNDSLKGFIALQLGSPSPPERLGRNHQRLIQAKNNI